MSSASTEPATSPASTSMRMPRIASRCSRRRTRRATRSPRSTARRGIRSPSGCCSRPRAPSAPTYAATLGCPVDRRPTSRARSAAAATRGSRTTPTVTSGSSRTSVARRSRARPRSGRTASSTATSRRRPAISHNGKLQALQVLNAAGDPITFDEPGGRQQSRPGRPAHLRPDLRHAAGSRSTTPGSTARRRSTPTTLAKAAHATPFKRPENGLFRPGSRFGEFYFDETGDTDATSPENGDRGRLDVDLQAHAANPSSDHGQLTLFYKGDQAHAGFDNVAFLSEDNDHVRRGRGRHAALAAQRARFGLRVRRHAELREPGEPAGALARRGSRPVGDARLGQRRVRQERGRQRDHRHRTCPTATRASAASSARRCRRARRPASWRWFYTQQHGDNPTYEVVPAKPLTPRW